ncbi:MAG: hypothetical protein HZB44_03980 [Actinobacteria bacterium]|nr:hypothetical protein [Actinomycetota bacterium]
MKNAVIVVVIIVAIFAVAAGVGLAFREESKPAAPVATTPSTQQLQEQYEQDVQALKDAVAEFQNADTYVSTDSIKSVFADVEDNYNAAVSSGKKVKDAKISELDKAYNNLKDAIDSAVGDSNQSLTQKVDSVKTALNAFVEELKQI